MNLGWKIKGSARINIPLPELTDSEVNFLVEFANYVHSESISESELEEQLLIFAENKGFYLSSSQQDYLYQYAYHHIFGYAFLDYLLDKEIEEIAVISINKPVYIFDKGWKRTNAYFTDEHYFIDIINRLAKDTGRRITYNNPRLDAILSDGSRLHASISPISSGELTIRKFSKKRFSIKDLFSIYPKHILSLFSLLFQSDSSVVIAGNTASGKTTLLNALFSFVPYNERIVIIEQTPEISLEHNHVVRLVASKEHNIFMKDLIYDSLRMRPDRLIIGEIRSNDETEAFFDAMVAGQGRGTYTTFHALSGNEFINRMKYYGISSYDLNVIDAVIIQRRSLIYDPSTRTNKELRILKEIYLPKYDLSFKDKGKGFDLLMKLISSKLNLSLKEIKEELKQREKYLSSKNFQRRFYGIKKNYK